MSTRAFRSDPTSGNTFYPRLLGTRGAVACEHYLAADAAADILKLGGNAVDAAVAGVLVEGLCNPQMHTIGGECPILIHMTDGNGVVSISGNTAAPEAATPEAYRERGLSDVPDEGVLAAGVPAAMGALLTALGRYGRLTPHPEPPIASPLQPHLGAHFSNLAYKHKMVARRSGLGADRGASRSDPPARRGQAGHDP